MAGASERYPPLEQRDRRDLTRTARRWWQERTRRSIGGQGSWNGPPPAGPPWRQTSWGLGAGHLGALIDGRAIQPHGGLARALAQQEPVLEQA